MVAGDSASASVDIWAVGVMLFKTYFPSLTPIPDSTSGEVPIPNHPNQVALLRAALFECVLLT